MTNRDKSDDRDDFREPSEHSLRYFTGRRELCNPDTLSGTATEFEPGIFHVRLDDQSNDAFWLEFTLVLSAKAVDINHIASSPHYVSRCGQ